ncbi:MAG: hypothetical protein ACTIC8_04440, partial [Leuconostoc falkenbergense]
LMGFSVHLNVQLKFYNLPYIYSGIKNADAISAGTDKDVNSLGIVAKNASTVVVTLDSPQPQFASLMSFPSFYPQNEAFNTKAG